ncbi:MAG TPA: TolC family protein [Gemmatimonadales bacterium]|nr:TolC family protein [Gemmatimonadales bacterium]
MLALLAALQFQLQAPSFTAARDDSFPTVTLAEALRQATGLDPNYVAAVGQVDNARWARRSAFAVFILPSVTASTQATEYNPGFFNPATFSATKYLVQAQATFQYDIFTGGQKVAELSRSAATLDAAHAGELQARFNAAFSTEATYYAVLSDAELLRVARERTQRAEQQLGVARARVVSGAAVQTDSLQLRLELSRAQVGQLLQETALRVARLSLGSRIGSSGPVDAVPLDSVLPATPPMTLDAAVEEATDQGPAYRQARALERAAAAVFRGRLGSYLPRVSLTGGGIGYDNHFYPQAAKITQLTLTVTLPIWDNFQRQTLISQARVSRDILRAQRDSAERSIRRDVTAAYDGYVTARAAADIAAQAVAVARESYRVQQSRYKAGASTILDLLKAQSDLDDAESGLVQARYAARLALAGLETIVGRRLFPEQEYR